MDRVKSYPLSRSIETKIESGYKHVHYGDIHTGIAELISKSSDLPFIMKGDYELLKKGDIILADASEDYQGIAKPAVVLDDLPYKLIAGLHTIALRPKNLDSLFLYYSMHARDFRKYGYKNGTGMKVFGISLNNVLKYELNYPSVQTQYKIGTLLKSIDDTIFLNQQELDALKQTKQAFLQKMFPKAGNKVPEIRFMGFKSEWKDTTLNNITKIIGGGTPDTKEPTFWDGEIDWYSPTEIGKAIYASGSVRKITQLGLEKSSAKILPANKTILFTSRAGIGDTAILKKNGSTNQGFQSLVVQDNCDVYFLYSMSEKIKKYALKNAAGSTFLEISGKNLGKMPILIPSFEEQSKIGEFFRQLDEVIGLKEQELEALKQTKQGFLQKMFA